MPRLLLILLALSSACHNSPPPVAPCPVPVPPPAVVVPGDPHCLTQPPPAVDPVVRELAALPAGAAGTRAQLDRLAAAYLAAVQYNARAWRACGSAQ